MDVFSGQAWTGAMTDIMHDVWTDGTDDARQVQ